MKKMADTMRDNASKDCFHKKSFVMKYNASSATFSQVELGSLMVGDQVRAYDPNKLTHTIERVVAIHDHAKDIGMPSYVMRVVKFTVESQGTANTMTLSKNHCVLVKNEKNSKFQRKKATDLQVGDIMFHTSGKNDHWIEGKLTKVEVCALR